MVVGLKRKNMPETYLSSCVCRSIQQPPTFVASTKPNQQGNSETAEPASTRGSKHQAVAHQGRPRLLCCHLYCHLCCLLYCHLCCLLCCPLCNHRASGFRRRKYRVCCANIPDSNGDPVRPIGQRYQNRHHYCDACTTSSFTSQCEVFLAATA